MKAELTAIIEEGTERVLWRSESLGMAAVARAECFGPNGFSFALDSEEIGQSQASGIRDKPMISGEGIIYNAMDISKSELEDLLNKVKSDFRFEYVGGGYFRDKNVPKGIKADTLHGSQILDEFCSELIRQYSPSPE